MLLSTKDLCRSSIHASDGVAGRVEQLLFHDATWHIKHLVACTGHWLTRQHVLVPPATITCCNVADRTVYMTRTRDQLAAFPDLSTDPSVTYQHQLQTLRSMTYPLGAADLGLWVAAINCNTTMDDATPADRHPAGDIHLRGTSDVMGYVVAARNAMAGWLSDIIIDDVTWKVRHVAVATGGWWHPKHVLIGVRDVRAFDGEHRTVMIDMWREDIERSPAYRPLMPRQQPNQAPQSGHSA